MLQNNSEWREQPLKGILIYRFESTILVLAWRDWGNHKKIQDSQLLLGVYIKFCINELKLILAQCNFKFTRISNLKYEVFRNNLWFMILKRWTKKHFVFYYMYYDSDNEKIPRFRGICTFWAPLDTKKKVTFGMSAMYVFVHVCTMSRDVYFSR